MQQSLSKFLTPFASASDKLINRFDRFGLWGQFVVGVLLGAVWSPCTGPTLGIAVGLAAQEGTRIAAAAIFFLFGTGAAIPLLLIAYGSRKVLLDRLGAASDAASAAKKLFGILLLSVGLLVLTGGDKYLETKLLAVSPDWLVELTVGL
jgi:cytochrome c biogenesis protein CcdA